MIEVTWWELWLGRIFLLTLGFAIWLLIVSFVAGMLIEIWKCFFRKDDC